MRKAAAFNDGGGVDGADGVGVIRVGASRKVALLLQAIKAIDCTRCDDGDIAHGSPNTPMTRLPKPPTRRPSVSNLLNKSATPRRIGKGHESSFTEVVGLIQAARDRALQAVNVELVGLYWRVGEYIQHKIAAAEWGEAVVEQLADYLAHHHADLKGFTRASLFRMRQFYTVYQEAPRKVAALLRQLPWTHNLTILARCKTVEEREFYLRQTVGERWTSRELNRQINAGLFERAVMSPTKVSAALRQLHPQAQQALKDVYTFDFLSLPEGHSEADLQRGLVANLKRFLLEFGRDFCFVGEEYPLQVGKRDFAIDLLLFHRGLQCLVAIELKVDEFQPEHVGQLSFYLEALDRNVRKAHEHPSVGVLILKRVEVRNGRFALPRCAVRTVAGWIFPFQDDTYH